MKPLSNAHYFLMFLMPIAILIHISASAQITEIGILTGRNSNYAGLEQAGPKIVGLYETGFTLYETDLSEFLTVTYPAPPSDYQYLSYPTYLTEATFDQDPNTIEYMMLIQRQEPLTNGVMVIRTDGTILLVDTIHGIGGANGWDQFSSMPVIMNTPTGTIMTLQQDISGQSRVYSLPGELPCLPCNFGGGDMGLTENDLPSFQLFPNPSTGMVTIDHSAFEQHAGALTAHLYDAAGKRVRSFALTGSTSSTISVADVAKGVYQVVLTVDQAPMGRPAALVVQ